jgi:hypothetical protein
VDERSALDAIVVIEAARCELDEHQQHVGAAVERLLVEPEAVAVPEARSRPHPAGREASAAAAREELSYFQRRLRLGYSRSGDAPPGRHRIGSRCCAVRKGSHEQERDLLIAQTRDAATSPARPRDGTSISNSDP